MVHLQEKDGPVVMYVAGGEIDGEWRVQTEGGAATATATLEEKEFVPRTVALSFARAVPGHLPVRAAVAETPKGPFSALDCPRLVLPDGYRKGMLVVPSPAERSRFYQIQSKASQ